MKVRISPGATSNRLKDKNAAGRVVFGKEGVQVVDRCFEAVYSLYPAQDLYLIKD